MKDMDGKTALHLACDSSCQLFEGDEGFTKPPPSYDVVHTLMKASPSTVHLEDGDGMNALEYAIISNAPLQVVKILQRSTREYFEKRKLHVHGNENEGMYGKNGTLQRDGDV
jgi:ankyrin repeat protein